MVIITIVLSMDAVMKLYITDDFLAFIREARVSEEKLAEVAKELLNGLHDGELVRYELYKKRIASPKQSKRDSNRGIIAVKTDEKMFFMDGWRKSDIPKRGKEIPDKLLEVYKLLAGELRNMSEHDIAKSVKNGLLKEVEYER